MLDADPGLSSRFQVEVELDAASPQECVAAVESKLQQQLQADLGGAPRPPSLLDDESRAAALSYFEERRTLPNFGNLRDAITFAETAIDLAHKRVGESADEASAAARAEGGDSSAEAEYNRVLQEWNGLPETADIIETCDKEISKAREAKDALIRRGLWGGGAPAAAPPVSFGSDSARAPNMSAATRMAALAAAEEQEAQPEVGQEELSDAEKEAGMIVSALLLAQSEKENVSEEELIDLVSGGEGAAEVRQTLKEEYHRSASKLELSADALDSVFDRILASMNEGLAAAATAREEQLRRATEDLQKRGIRDAAAHDKEMRRLCEETTVTVTRICTFCGRADDPYSGCAYKGQSPMPKFIENVEKRKKFKQLGSRSI